ncbi:cyclic nucleotide-binding domain protein (macronuclear) [Tetrahymena thermophila SB210]|uniref:Cyclic nucleotide-binding domain protein n=1 Tax=Tetrahymena thermophila (strain SB210) TaxID=312017 RepID=I7M6L6_TETTS|nr:cyclic nucleotide-binding domain protein [Tetrahymena thermophila SB210]EAR85437.2 cyclic nucleotide-binding domain protein [Tetrahymena thermophila SB210]|eukprot:XP_001033100.2 cyclic nucleotide-binding domain protein [Tetrahymena thermophila SB210]
MKEQQFGSQQQKDLIQYLELNQQERKLNQQKLDKALEAAKNSQYIQSAILLDQNNDYEQMLNGLLHNFQIEKYEVGTNIIPQTIAQNKFVFVIQGHLLLKIHFNESQNDTKLNNINGLQQLRKNNSLNNEQEQIQIVRAGEVLNPQLSYQYHFSLKEAIAMQTMQNNMQSEQQNGISQEDFIYLATLSSDQYSHLLSKFEEKKMQLLIDTLNQIPFFETLNEDKLSYIISISKIQQFRKRTIVYKEGSVALDVFAVLYGDFLITRKEEGQEQEIENQKDQSPNPKQNNGNDVKQAKRKIIDRIQRNQMFGEEDILYSQKRINTASCSSEQGLVLRIPKQIYCNLFDISKLKSKSQDSVHNDESPSLQTADFFVRQNFTNTNTRNIEQSQQPQTNQITDLQGSQLIFSQKPSNRQFTKLQISQMQNNSATITQFSKTNKQLLNILNNKLQHQSSGSQQNQSNGLSTNKQSEDSGSASNKNARNFHLQQFSSANFSQGQLSNSSSKCFSPIVSNCDVNEHTPSKIKLSQFRVKKYQSERSISMAKQSNQDKIEDSDSQAINKNVQDKLNLQSFTNKFNEIQDVKNSFRFQSTNKNSSPVVAQQGFQLKLNSGILQKHQKNISSRHSDIVLASHELQQSSSSQRGCQSPEKTSFSPANPMRRTFLIDQNKGTIIKKRGLNGIQFASQVNLQKPSTLNEFDDQKFNKQASDEFNYPNSDGIEGDTQKNQGRSPIQTFSIATKQSCDNLFSKAQICNESSPNVSVTDALRKSKIQFQYRKKPSSVAVGSCSDFQSLKNIDADQFSKEIQTNINTQLSNKFIGKNSSAIFFSNNFEKSPLSSQQNLPSWKSTANTKLQMNFSNQTSPKKNFILKKSQILTQSNNGSMQQIPSIHNFINNQEIDSQKKQNEVNSQSSRLEDSNDSSFMIYDDYASHLASLKQNIEESPQNQQTNENENKQQKSKKPKPSIPLLDLKSITQNQQVNNFFNNIPNQQNQQQNQNQKSTEQNVNKFQDSKLIIDQKQNITEQSNQINQGNNQQKQLTSNNQRPSTPSIKKLDLSNLNEQLKKQTPINVQKEEGFTEITQSRLILPSFNQNINSNYNPQENKTPQSTKFDFFSPCKIQDDIKVFEKNIFQTAQQAQNNTFFSNQPNQYGHNKSKQTIQNINSLYQGLLTSQNFKKQSLQSNSRKNTINLKELS